MDKQTELTKLTKEEFLAKIESGQKQFEKIQVIATDLTKILLNDLSISDSVFTEVNFGKSHFKNCEFENVDIQQCNFEKTKFFKPKFIFSNIH
ncbi:MAG: pentapeptide repeat-containing protein, partial [Jaaginema sp. PMC 1079.18]|nr:pentapeptide repeat-containing protein [Jaaginema sp. PMC 1079.18]